MGVDPYSLCPCGSGEKFKWCCHKVEAYAERAQRLYAGGQHERALEPLEEGLRKEPGNAWLLLRKTLVLIGLERNEEALETTRRILIKSPRNVTAHLLLLQLTTLQEGGAAGAARLQEALAIFPPEAHPRLIEGAVVVAASLSREGLVPAALAHLDLILANADSILDQEDSRPTYRRSVQLLAQNRLMIMEDPEVPAWLKEEFALRPAPEGSSGPSVERFTEALKWADVNARWSSAAAVFETLGDDPVCGPAADWNAAACRLRVADTAGALIALRRYLARLGNTPEAVDVVALCHSLEDQKPQEEVEHVQLSWTLRNREGLLAALRSDPEVWDEGRAEIDEEDPKLGERDEFAICDRQTPPGFTSTEYRGEDLSIEQIPVVLGHVFVTPDTAILDSFDDGRLDKLTERFTGLAGGNIAPAHPRTKVLGKVPRLQLALSWEWLLPTSVPRGRANALKRERAGQIILDVWPKTPNPFLRGRTPERAARDGDAEVPLRAEVLRLMDSLRRLGRDFPADRLRTLLRLPDEPMLDPQATDAATIPLARMRFLPLDRASDEQLGILFARALGTAMSDLVVEISRELVRRPGALDNLELQRILPYEILASHALEEEKVEDGREWLRKGRQSDPRGEHSERAVHWDLAELRLQMHGPMETWVPALAILLDRYRENVEASQQILMALVGHGLIKTSPHPDRPGEVLVDMRPLMALFEEYGPRVTTASGRLGISAGKPEIWTPGGGAGSTSPGGIWTPGSSSSTPPGERKLILPGS